MKAVILKLLIIFLYLNAFGQQRPQYTQYIFNNYLLNPAISGIERYIDVKMGHRSQWQGLDGAPVTTYVSVHAPVGNKYTWANANSFSESGSNPMSRSRVLDYQAAEPHHGVGLQAVTDKTGPISRLNVNASYAYHLGLSPKLNLAVGISAGVFKVNVDLSQLNPLEANDAAIQSSTISKLEPDLGAGLWLYGPQFFVGLSGVQLISQKLTAKTNEQYHVLTSVPHFFGTAGFKMFLTEDIAAIPSIMLSKASTAPVSVDMNTKLAFRDRFWIGGSYRKNDSFSAMAGFNISHLFNLSYSYDFTVSELQSVSSGSHEVVLGLLLNNRYKVTCPERTW